VSFTVWPVVPASEPPVATVMAGRPGEGVRHRQRCSRWWPPVTVSALLSTSVKSPPVTAKAPSVGMELVVEFRLTDEVVLPVSVRRLSTVPPFCATVLVISPVPMRMVPLVALYVASAAAPSRLFARIDLHQCPSLMMRCKAMRETIELHSAALMDYTPV